MDGRKLVPKASFMTRTHHRTWQKHRCGHFLVTVHLDPVVDAHSVEQHRGLAEAAGRLIRLMEAHRLPTSWAVSDPAYSAATPSIIRSNLNHELAILGDANWVGPTAGRTRFARELARRVSQARSAGIELKTLVPRVASIKRHLDLVIKQRITAIGGTVECPSGQLALPRALHYGLWELPAARTLPIKGSSLMFNGGWSTWRQIRRASRNAAPYHLVIDAPALLHEGQRAERTVAKLMRRVGELRDRGLLRLETLSAAAARLSDVPALSPQRSILSRAA
jgi:hypothetical protein